MHMTGVKGLWTLHALPYSILRIVELMHTFANIIVKIPVMKGIHQSNTQDGAI
jgi:hypothetical protein